MSALYNLEPQPTAKVLLTTTGGDILLELFAKQTPVTSRNFLQLCLDGYYNDTIFHRLVPGFILQGGDPSGTGSGGEAIYPGGLFADEFHSRLKFNRRGLLGMANGGVKDDNGSQFFVTLAETPELQDRNTMFGRVVGDTIYNIMKMGELELQEATERPLYPIKVTGTEVLVNPFTDMVKRLKTAKAVPDQVPGKKKPKKKGGKGLLSFGEDGDDIGALPPAKKAKLNPRLIDPGLNKETDLLVIGKGSLVSEPKAKSKKHTKPPQSPPSVTAAIGKAPTADSLLKSQASSSRSSSVSTSPEPISKAEQLLSKTNAEIDLIKASMRRTIAKVPEKSESKSFLESMIPATAIRGKKRKGNGSVIEARQRSSLAQLDAFRKQLGSVAKDVARPAGSSVEMADQAEVTNGKAGEYGPEEEEAALCDLHFIVDCQSCSNWETQDGAEDEDDGQGTSWMGHTLNFEKDRLGKDLKWKKHNEDEMIVIDPQEREKEISQKRKSERSKSRR
ncbi:MAG: Peptidyl-prolyl isomerase cwc27 [Vezdaea aestivalis]|nr:MAG: Peptidyl-prolyl isomerase cwc27 [Vezdaea aestivalis]